LARLKPGQIALELTAPRRTHYLDVGGELHIVPCEPVDASGTVCGPAEAVLRLVYGRNRAEDDVTAAGAITMDDLRSLFPGY
jgi:hypothetical protein